MQDIQNSRPRVEIPINQVGIRGLRYPFSLKAKGGGSIATTATVSMFVSLPAEFKGTHMSRFVEILNDNYVAFHNARIRDLLKTMLLAFDAESAYVYIQFPYFLWKSAPITGLQGMVDYDCQLFGYMRLTGDSEMTVKVTVPVTAVCPCSKEISDRGAHNQRGLVTIEALEKIGDTLWIEDLIQVAEAAGSSEIYALLKRPDEKFITEKGYDNPKFVEDIARDVASLLERKEITKFIVEISNEESIHNHQAYAMIATTSLISRLGAL